MSPRDQVTWLKIQHRNLWVAASGGLQDTKCRVRGCRAEENQEHLVLCPGIQKDFWVNVAILMSHLNMDAGNSSKKWILGITADGSQVSREEAAIIFWAWRCLYAEVVGEELGRTTVAWSRLKLPPT